MTTLEAAIKRARLSISEGDEIIIDRSMFASRKKGKLSEVTLEEKSAVGKPVHLNHHSKELSAEAKFWKQKFEILKREKNEEEEDLEHLLEITAEREAKLIELARLLERKIDHMSTPAGSSGSETYSKLENQRKLLRFYELMTGMTISESERDNQILCTMKNRMKRLVTRFAIEVPEKENQEISYVPLANISLLPEYLQGEIACEKAAVPVIIGDILQSLFEESGDA